jgi:hypothetical protein
MKRILVFLALLMVFAVGTARAGQAVYNQGDVWTAFNDKVLYHANVLSSGTHAIMYDTRYSITGYCDGTTVGVNLWYKLGPTSDTADLVYPDGVSWIAYELSIAGSNSGVINFEPPGNGYIQLYMSDQHYAWSSTSVIGSAGHVWTTPAACTIYFYEQ